MKTKLTKICTPKQWKTIPTNKLLCNGYPVYGANGIIGYYNEYNHEKSVVTITCRGATCGAINMTVPQSYVTGNAMCLDNLQSNVLIEYLYYCLLHYDFDNVISGSAQPQITRQNLEKVEIELYPIEKQKKIITILNKVKTIIATQKQELQKLDELVKARFIELFGAISEEVPLSYYIGGLNAGKSLAGEEENPNKVLKTGAATYDYFDETQIKNLPIDYEPQENHRVKAGDVIISRMNTAKLVGAAAYVWDVPERVYLPDRLWRAEVKETANSIFVWQVLIQSSTKESIRRIASGTSGSMKNISKPGLLGIRVVKAPIELQEQFAVFVEQTNKSKVVVQKALNKAQLLFDSLMQKYFG